MYSSWTCTSELPLNWTSTKIHFCLHTPCQLVIFKILIYICFYYIETNSHVDNKRRVYVTKMYETDVATNSIKNNNNNNSNNIK